jgi:membrane protease YdiL (CAAX protease family)
LPLWTILGAVAAMAGIAAVSALGASPDDELLGVLLYLPMAAWVLVMVSGRAGVNLRAMFRWPRLGAYWGVVAGMFVVQFLFTMAAVTLTQLVAPGFDDALAGVGQGSLLLAVLGLVVLPPLVEETVFRGVLLERVTVKWNLVAAILVSSALFGILHVDPVGAGVFGVVTSLLYLRTGSLWPGILIHLVNNGVALGAMRLVGSDVEAPAPELTEALSTAGVLLLVSVPFLAWFIWTHWPRRGQPTPYQRFEQVNGLPQRHVEGLMWSGAPGRVLRLTATSSHLVVGMPSERPEPLAVLPLEAVRAVYPSPVPGGEQVVVVLNDGTWTAMRVRNGAVRANRDLAAIIRERAGSVPGVALHA